MSLELLQRTKDRIKERVAPTKLSLKAGLSLFMEKPSNPTVRRKVLYDELASTPIREPLNREDDLYSRFLSVLDRRQIPVTTILQDQSPYWMPESSYNMMEVGGTSMQFFDHHDAELPKTTLPPVEHLETFIERVLQSPEPVTVDQQFDMLLDITGNNIIGAANLGMLATRYMSRFADSRAYPAVTIEGKEYTQDTSDQDINEAIRKWNSKTSKFETYNTSDKNDGLGDSYYFWTHLFGTMLLNTNGLSAKAMEKIFKKVTELMIFAKYTIARRKGNILPHYESSQLGREFGLAFIEQAKNDITSQE